MVSDAKQIRQFIPKNECPACKSKNVKSEPVPETNHWLYSIHCNDCGRDWEHNEGDKQGGGFDTIKEKTMDMQLKFELNDAEAALIRGKDGAEQAGIMKGQIFQHVSQHVTEALYNELYSRQSPMGHEVFQVNWLTFTVPEFIQFLEELKEFPNKVDDQLRIYKKKHESTLEYNERFTSQTDD